MPLQFALDYVYQDLKQKHAKYQHIWDKKQRYKWDRQPITNEQIALIHKLAPDYKIDTHKMTRGDASRAIQLLTYKPEEWTPQTTPSEVQDDAKKRDVYKRQHIRRAINAKGITTNGKNEFAARDFPQTRYTRMLLESQQVYRVTPLDPHERVFGSTGQLCYRCLLYTSRCV